MIQLRKSEDRGHANLGWLDTKHTFSFAQYYDEKHMGFSDLRVINEDVVNPGKGFGAHPHRDMEIVTYVMEGALEHKDSLGTGSIIVPGDVQRMSAGTGIVHSEFNPLEDQPVHLLQIWIMPDKNGVTPSYEQKNFTEVRAPGKLTLVASKDGRDGSLTIQQDAKIQVLDLAAGQDFRYELAEGRTAWLQVARGSATVNGQALNQGDGASVAAEKSLAFKAGEKAEILVFDLAA